MKIFAYGSNLSTDRLRARVPSARFLGRARLNGYCLRFHKRSIDGSAKANAWCTGNEADCVWGAVFECTELEKRNLDRAEGLGRGYEEVGVTVVLDDGTIEMARTYVASPDAVDDTLKPYTWYHAHVLAGAEEQVLPDEYVGALRQQSAVRDPNKE